MNDQHYLYGSQLCRITTPNSAIRVAMNALEYLKHREHTRFRPRNAVAN